MHHGELMYFCLLYLPIGPYLRFFAKIVLAISYFSSPAPSCITYLRFYYNEAIDEDLQHQEKGRAGEDEQVPRGGARTLHDEARQDRGKRPRSQAALLQGVNQVNVVLKILNL